MYPVSPQSPVEPPGDAKEAIRARALALGFAAVGFAGTEGDPDDHARLLAFLAEGRHGDMAWMAESVARRSSPRALWPEARTVVALAENYAPQQDDASARPGFGRVSVYARGRDYHDVVKKRLKALARFVVERLGGEVKVFADTAPLMEKPLAVRSGLGWQGRHTNLISPRLGCWLFLGFVFTTAELAPDTPGTDRCGRCRACEAACPTSALAGGRIDPRRCLSYLTIEHKGPIPLSLRPALGNRIYGCDDCLAACPWNRFARPAIEAAYLPRVGIRAPSLAELAILDDAAFRTRFAGSPIKRIGRDRLLRNVMTAIGNSDREDLVPLAIGRLDDASPLVQDAAAWAVSRLLGKEPAF